MKDLFEFLGKINSDPEKNKFERVGSGNVVEENENSFQVFKHHSSTKYFLPGMTFYNRDDGQNDLEKNTVQPVTVRMCLFAKREIPNFPLQINGVDVNNVEVIGFVLDINVRSNFNVYVLDDGTGIIEVRQRQTRQEEETFLEVGQYARACGSLKQVNEKKEIESFHIRPVIDADEITYHILHIIQTYIVRTNRIVKPEKFSSHLKNSPNNPRNMGGGGAGPAVSDKTSHLHSPQKTNSDNSSFRNDRSDFKNFMIFPTNRNNNANLEAELKSFLRNDRNQLGLTKLEIAYHFRGRFSSDEVKKTIDRLHDEGALLSRFEYS